MTQCSRRRTALYIFLFFLCLYGLTNRGSIWSSDAAMRLGMAEHLVDGGAVGIPDRLLPHLESHGGRAIWGIGHPIALVPSVLISRAAGAALSAIGHGGPATESILAEGCATMTNVLIGALTCALLFLTGCRLGFDTRVSALAALAFGAGTLWWVYTQDAFYEPLQGLCLLGAFYWAARARGDGAPWLPAASGACLGMAVLTKLPNAIMLLPTLLLWALPRRAAEQETRRRPAVDVLAFTLGIAPFVAVQLWADWSAYGTMLPGALDRHAKYAAAWEQGNILRGLILSVGGLEQGLVWYSPTILLAFAWFGEFRAHDRRFAGILALTTVLAALMVAQTTGVGLEGMNWGGRYLVPFLPLFGLLLLPWIHWARLKSGRWGRWATVLLFAAAFDIQLLGTAVHIARFYNERQTLPPGASLTIPYSSPLFRQPAYLDEILGKMARGEPHHLSSTAHGVTDDRELLSQARALNVVNYWWVLAYYEGVPAALLGGIVSLLLAVLFLALGRTVQSTRNTARE